MTTDTTTPPEVTPEARKVQMLDLWGATVTHLLDRLKGDDADKLTASFMDTVVGFLRDSAISADTVAEAKDAMDDLNTELALQIASIKAEQDSPVVVPPKAPKSAARVVTPLEQPFEVRTPRS